MARFKSQRVSWIELNAINPRRTRHGPVERMTTNRLLQSMIECHDAIRAAGLRLDEHPAVRERRDFLKEDFRSLWAEIRRRADGQDA